MAYYRRQTNWAGWIIGCLLVIVILAGVFGGLYFLQLEQDKRDKKAAAAAKPQEPGLDNAVQIIKDHLKKMYKQDGKALQTIAANPAKEVNSGKLKKKVILVRIQHKPAGGDDDDIRDEIFMFDGSKIIGAKKGKEWDELRQEYQLDDEP